MRVLAINPGSSSLKFALFEGETCLERGNIEGRPDELSVSKLISDHQVGAIGCRVVHGGDLFMDSVRVTEQVLSGIQSLAPLAPLHNHIDAAVLRIAMQRRPEIPVIAVFDTAFHRTMPRVARCYAVPQSLGIRRFGFHGIAYSFIARTMPTLFRRVVACHLGNGASVCAMLDGQSIDTSMGFTPLEGLMMGTRSGNIDPGAVLYLLRNKRMTIDQVDHTLNHESGLLGVSGISSDVRELSGHTGGEFALDLFAYRVAQTIGAYAVALGGLDALVFSGGIGEHSSEVRSRVCGKLSALGIDAQISEPTDASASRIGEGTPSVWVVRVDEEAEIARETVRLAV